KGGSRTAVSFSAARQPGRRPAVMRDRLGTQVAARAHRKIGASSARRLTSQGKLATSPPVMSRAEQGGHPSMGHPRATTQRSEPRGHAAGVYHEGLPVSAAAHAEPGHRKHGAAEHRHGGGGSHHAHMVADFRRRFWVSLILSIPVLALSPLIQAWLG